MTGETTRELQTRVSESRQHSTDEPLQLARHPRAGLEHLDVRQRLCRQTRRDVRNARKPEAAKAPRAGPSLPRVFERYERRGGSVGTAAVARRGARGRRAGGGPAGAAHPWSVDETLTPSFATLLSSRLSYLTSFPRPGRRHRGHTGHFLVRGALWRDFSEPCSCWASCGDATLVRWARRCRRRR